MIEIHSEQSRFQKPMVDGANALVLQPEILQRPQLQLVKPATSFPEPIPIQKYLDRRRQLVEEPMIAKPVDVSARQQIMESSAPDAERFIEREIDPDKPWSAFGQVMFVREHIVDGRSVKKIAAISIAYPGGVGTRMAGEAIARTIGVKESEFEHWKGLKEGELIAASKEVSDVTKQLDLIDSFIDNSGSVIANRHARVEHEVVQHFFDLQDPRRDFLERVKEDAIAILTNPEFTGWSAMNEEYKDKGIYLVEGIVEDGVWDGGDTQGKRVHLKDIPVDEPHSECIQWAGKTIDAMVGDGVLGDAEDTETVTHCGGRNGCSEFFNKMEGDSSLGINLKVSYSEVTGITGAINSSESPKVTFKSGGGGRVERDYCSNCDSNKNSHGQCKCSKS